MNADWPYPDLECLTPDCPLCGNPGRMMVGSMLHPIAWCTTEGCPGLMWDPTITLAELRATQAEIVETVDPVTGAIHWRPSVIPPRPSD